MGKLAQSINAARRTDYRVSQHVVMGRRAKSVNRRNLFCTALTPPPPLYCVISRQLFLFLCGTDKSEIIRPAPAGHVFVCTCCFDYICCVLNADNLVYYAREARLHWKEVET
jgi:hypothetical protein